MDTTRNEPKGSRFFLSAVTLSSFRSSPRGLRSTSPCSMSRRRSSNLSTYRVLHSIFRTACSVSPAPHNFLRDLWAVIWYFYYQKNAEISC